MSIVSELKEAKTHINTAIAMIESGSPVEPPLQWDTKTYDKLSWSEVQAVLDMRPGWRVPTIQQLVSVLKPENMPRVVDDLVPVFEVGWYWSSTPYHEVKNYDFSTKYGTTSTARTAPKSGQNPQTCNLILVR